MAAHYVVERAIQEGQTVRELAFAGDSVRLSGQVDYPDNAISPLNGFPLLFILHNSSWHTRKQYEHFAQTGLQCGYAVFRWDKRGTGRSGGGGIGTTTQDALRAYETAINQPRINSEQVIIIAQNEGTLLLGDCFKEFKAIQKPTGVILVGNMLNNKEITSIDAPIRIIMGRNDWNDWKIYAKDVCSTHDQKHGLDASYFVATNANRLLKMGENMFHVGAQHSIQDWLTQFDELHSKP